jgi:hypothetical protein
VKNPVPHVTVSVAPDTGAVYSNELLERRFDPVEGPLLEAVVLFDR